MLIANGLLDNPATNMVYVNVIQFHKTKHGKIGVVNLNAKSSNSRQPKKTALQQIERKSVSKVADPEHGAPLCLRDDRQHFR